MAASAQISLLVADVDGTLVTRDKVLTERARGAVRRLRQKGLHFAITSGRPPRGMGMLIAPLAIEEPVAGFNGGVFTRPDLSVLETHELAPEDARRAAALLDEHGLDTWVYTGEDWFVRNPKAPHVDREAWTVAFAPKVVGDFDAQFANTIKVVGIGDDYALVERAETEIGRALDGKASVARSQPYYIDVTNPSANKAQVVRFHARRLGISTAAIATIGDMPNDVLMFRESGLSIAMGNAAPDVQKQATVVTDSCDEEGFAKAVERYLLGDGS